jgi:rhomboid family GlyGly-CTERM serine protease
MKSLRLPLLLFALPAVVVAFAPARHDLLLLDREALATGQFWRLWSGHWLHFSASHLVWNLVVLLTAGTCLERLRPGLLLRHVVIAAPLIGVAIMIFEPALRSYGGLSGLATAVTVLLSLHHLRLATPARPIWIGVLALVAAKSVHDALFPGSLLVDYTHAAIQPSVTAHLAGAVVAMLSDGVTRAFTARAATSGSPGHG